jgi:hypothetical protein
MQGKKQNKHEKGSWFGCLKEYSMDRFVPSTQVVMGMAAFCIIAGMAAKAPENYGMASLYFFSV